MKIIVGLGNPGEKYNDTRHNIGFEVLNMVVSEKGLSWQINKKFNAELCKDGDVVYVKPLTYMNNSGQAVQAVLSYYKLLPKKLGFIKQKESDLSEVLTIIHDDLDIEFGKIKESIDSRSGGHNGVQSIINYLRTKNFKRVRIGLKTRFSNSYPAEKFVLQKFNAEELEVLRNVKKDAERFF